MSRLQSYYSLSLIHNFLEYFWCRCCVGAGTFFLGCAIFLVIVAVFLVYVVTIIVIVVVIHSCSDIMCIETIVVDLYSATVSVSEDKIFIAIFLDGHVFHLLYYILWYG